MSRYRITILLFLLLAGTSSYASQPVQSLYLAGKNDSALILCHGRGKHPDWQVVSPLRKSVNRQLGWHTLSLQMPAENKNWRDYADDFPSAFKTIEAAIHFLKKEKKVKYIVLMGHSMGARMASSYMAQANNKDIKALVVAGCRNNGGAPLECDVSLKQVSVPVLDIWGDDSKKDVDAAYQRQSLLGQNYTQRAIQGADHRFKNYESKFVENVIKWLKVTAIKNAFNY